MIMKSKNEHLIPVVVTNLVEQFNKCDSRSGEFSAYAARLTAMRDYIDQSLKNRKFK